MRIQLTDAEQADGRMHEANLDLAVRLLREVGAVILEKAVPLEIVKEAQTAYFDAIRRGVTRKAVMHRKCRFCIPIHHEPVRTPSH